MSASPHRQSQHPLTEEELARTDPGRTQVTDPAAAPTTDPAAAPTIPGSYAAPGSYEAPGSYGSAAARSPSSGAVATAPTTGTATMPRSRGALTGLILVVLGVWGAIVPFIGPYFHYQFINHSAWSFPTYGRLWLEILPGAVTVLAGLMLIGVTRRGSAVFAGMLAVIAGGWFVIGQTVSMLWNHGFSQAGTPLGGNVMRTIEQLGYFYVLGAAIVALGALIAGRMAATPARDGRTVAPRAPEPGASY